MNLSEQTKIIQSFIQSHPNVNTFSDSDELHKFYGELIDCLVDHNHLYYVESNPIISDKEYDELFSYLKKIEELHPELISSNSPTQSLVGQVSDWFVQARHTVKLASLENTYNSDDLNDRDERAKKVLHKSLLNTNGEEKTIWWTGIILQTKDQKYIFQKRDHNTDINPWKIVLFGWWLQEKEEYKICAVRELKEELQIDIDPDTLEEIGDFKSHVFPNTYIKIFYCWSLDESHLRLQEWEKIIKDSLENIDKNPDITLFTKEVLQYFQEKYLVSYTIEPKFDGLSVELIYKNGKFTQAITRGDGRVGEDITANAKTIKNIPQKLKHPVDISVRGEIMMPKSVWKDLNKEREEEGEIPFANTRNAASWSIKLLDSKEVAKRGLVCYVYDILRYITTDHNKERKTTKINIYNQKISWEKTTEEIENILETLWLPVYPRTKQCTSIQEVIETCLDNKIKQQLESEDIDFDGLVIKVKDQSQRDILGSTDHHPRWAVAYKFPAQLASTQIISVDFQVGRTGIITPVGNLEPVELSGVTIKRVSLHNFDFIKEKDLHIGDYVRIQRSGEVIPYVVSVIKERRPNDAKEIEMPGKCPSCGWKVKNEDIHYYCTNPKCQAKLKEQILHFVSKNCMDIQGIWESIVDILVEQNIVQSIADIYKIPEHSTQILLRKFPGIGDKKVAEIINEIEESKHQPLRRLLNWLWIPHVGKKMAQDIVQAMVSQQPVCLEDILHILTDRDFLITVYGIGDKTLDALVDYFSNTENQEMLMHLRDIGMKFAVDAGGYDLFKEKKESFSITGTFPVSRETIVTALEKEGYIFHDTPIKSTQLMLIGEKAWSKKEKAQELWLKIYEGWDILTKYFPVLATLKINETPTQPKITQTSLFG